MAKMPKEFKDALRKRKELAIKLMCVSAEVDDYIKKYGLDEIIEDFDYLTGFEIYCNPRDSEARIKKAWERKYNNG